MIDILNDHQMHIERQKNQIVILHNEIAEQDICLSKFQDTLNQIDFSNFQDNFKKFIKLSDFLLLINDKNSKFENWLSHIINKLIINNDHYITEILYMIYVKNQIKDNAVKYLISQLWLKVSNCFKNTEKMLDYLKFIYFNFNQLQNAKTQFWWLMMKNENDYYEFLIKFLHLTDEVQMSDMKYKYKLNMKFLFFLQKMMIQKYLKINFFQKFSTYCSQMIQIFKKINKAENHIYKLN